jgi:hypothetical protein
MSKRIVVGISSALTALFLTASVAHATTTAIGPGDGWHEFDVDDFSSNSGGLEWIDFNNGSELKFSVTLVKAAILTVVDAAFAGDAFKVFDKGVAIGVTPTVPSSYPNSNGLDFDGALADPAYSHATFLLAAGDHLISGLLSTSIIVD